MLSLRLFFSNFVKFKLIACYYSILRTLLSFLSFSSLGLLLSKQSSLASDPCLNTCSRFCKNCFYYPILLFFFLFYLYYCIHVFCTCKIIYQLCFVIHVVFSQRDVLSTHVTIVLDKVGARLSAGQAKQGSTTPSPNI